MRPFPREFASLDNVVSYPSVQRIMVQAHALMFIHCTGLDYLVQDGESVACNRERESASRTINVRG